MKLKDQISSLSTALIFGIPIFSGRYVLLLDNLQNHLFSGQKRPLWWLTTPNAEQVVLAKHDDMFRSFLMRSTLAIPDGASLVISSGILALKGGNINQIRERISGVDVMGDLIAKADQRGMKVMLLGGDATVSQKAAAVVRRKYPGVRIAQDPGAKNIKIETKAEKDRVIGKISKFKPDLLFVGYGAPYQEQWIADNRLDLEKAGIKIAMGVGGAFDMLAGKIRRAPMWMREAGLEWLWRLMQEPWRWKRQMRLLTYWGMVLRELFTFRSN